MDHTRVQQMRTLDPRIIIRVDRGNVARQMGNRTPRTTALIPAPPRRLPVVHLHDSSSSRRAPAAPSVALAELDVVVLSSPRSGGIVAAAPVGERLGGADGDEGGEFARAGASAAAEGELADDQGGEVAEEVGHGDEAAADDAGGDFGDTVGCCVVRGSGDEKMWGSRVYWDGWMLGLRP